jgi:hypothetical protein
VDDEVELLLADLEKLEGGHQTLSRDQLRDAVKDLVEMVDGYLTFSAIEFLACGDRMSESNFECPISPGVWSIEPNLPVYHKRVERYAQFLDRVLSNKKPSFENNLSDTVVELIAGHRQSGYYMGILVGAKMTGASTKEMRQLGTRLFEVLDGQPRYYRT